MPKKKIFILLTLFFLLHLGSAASKFKKGGSFSSRKRDSDGFGSFGRSSKRDNDGFFKSSSYDDDSMFKVPMKKYNQRTNLYAGKKVQQFGANFGRGFGSLLLGLFGVSTQEPKVVAGKRIKSSINIQASNHDLTYDWLSNTIIAIAVFCCIVLIFYIIAKKPFTQSEDDIMIKHAKNKYKETYKNYQILKFIEENGVHPDRATGKIYKIQI